MIGRNNVGGGGSSSTWYAYIQVSTDANAHISAINLHGDVYQGTANSSGSLVITVYNPGTYTVSETGGGATTVVVSDYGVAYNVSIYNFDGLFIVSGETSVQFSAIAYPYSSYTGIAPTIETDYFNDIKVISVIQGSGSGRYLTTNSYNISSFSQFKVNAVSNGTSHFFIMDENGGYTWLADATDYYMAEITASLSGFDRSKKYKFGVWLFGEYQRCQISNMRLQ